MEFETMQVFTKSSQQWKARPLAQDETDRFLRWQDSREIWPVVGHTSYLINIASPDEGTWRKSVDALVVELERCSLLGIGQLVLHPGSHLGQGEELGLDRIRAGLDLALERTAGAEVSILLENTAGQGHHLGYAFHHLGELISNAAGAERLGVCFDTCHAFAAGYDLRTVQGYTASFQEFDAAIGLDRLHVFHFNDSKRELGSRVDRHEHIGKGELGLEAFRQILNDPRFDHLPMILETPKGPDMAEDRENLRTLRELIGPDTAAS
jgi:deoxyribonuclease-4